MNTEIKREIEKIVAYARATDESLIRLHLEILIAMIQRDESEKFTKSLKTLFRKPHFENVSCSQCGKSFGPGDHGYSHCEAHLKRIPA